MGGGDKPLRISDRCLEETEDFLSPVLHEPAPDPLNDEIFDILTGDSPLRYIGIEKEVEKVDFPFDYGPFDDEWDLNYKFDDSIVQDTLPYKEESPIIQKPTDSFPKREEDDISTVSVDAMSPVSVESLNTLIGWANHNPYEDEQSTDSDNLTDWDNIY
ncbi:hypothetical protein E3N88_17809 [Mikania micrantha]|uniref:Uncharacterized protein n=1 Tax=Mikania micrantha TaxID=192012 RepID=A0A5N6NUP0_9ASTR|nr:hypothetical protein E3N88_17809 [Mikania micrantha]